MPVRKFKPTSPGRRFMTVSTFDDVTKSKPEKSLLEPIKKKGGRNNNGRITTRHQGGGHKRRYRVVDFKRLKDGVPAKVAAIEYDPNRSARIALLHYADGAKSYILAPARLRVGATVESGPAADIKPGNALPLENVPTGTLVHNVELKPGQGGKMARSRRLGRPAGREGRRLRGAQAPLRGDAQGAAILSGHRRPGRKPRPRERDGRQGGPEPVEGEATVGARLRDEPRRPSARRRRGEVEGRPSPGDAVGRADARQADAAQAQGLGQVDRAEQEART